MVGLLAQACAAAALSSTIQRGVLAGDVLHTSRVGGSAIGMGRKAFLQPIGELLAKATQRTA